LLAFKWEKCAGSQLSLQDVEQHNGEPVPLMYPM